MKLITTTLTAIAIALPAYADTVKATVSRVDPIYHNTTVNTPRNICQNVEVPIYGTVQGGGATGGGSDQVFIENDQTVTTNYTISTNKNAVSAGTLTVNSGVTVTVPSGARWVVV